MANPADDGSLGGAVLYGVVYGALFGVGCSALALWNGAAEQFPLMKVAVGFTGFTVLFAVACGVVALGALLILLRRERE